MALAHEYQVKDILEKADKYLAHHYRSKMSRQLTSAIIIQGIFEAEKYNITRTLNVLIGLASKKAFRDFSSANGYDELKKSTLYRIAMKRWEDD